MATDIWVNIATLAQVIDWCLTAPSHYLNQCWLNISVKKPETTVSFLFKLNFKCKRSIWNFCPRNFWSQYCRYDCWWPGAPASAGAMLTITWLNIPSSYLLQCFNEFVQDKLNSHNDLMIWKHFQHYWPFMSGIHQSPVVFPHKGLVLQSFDVLFTVSLN